MDSFSDQQLPVPFLSGFNMNKILKILDRVLSVWLIFLMGTMTISIILSVILRYVFNITFVKAEEAITMVFVATTFYGAALGIRESDHISITYFRDKAGPSIGKIMDILVNLIIIIVMAFLLKNSLLWIRKVGSIPTPGMQIPAKYFYVMFPVSSILSMLYSAVNIFSIFFNVVTPEYGYEREDFSENGECAEEEQILIAPVQEVLG